MSVLTGPDLIEHVGTILGCGGVLGLVSPYLSDFKYWGNLRGSQRTKRFLTEILMSATLENDGRVLLVTDPESLERTYSRDLLQEIMHLERSFWIYVFTVPALHAKLLLRNDQAIVGSANFTYSAFARNVEVGYHVTDESDLSELKAFVNALVLSANPVSRSALELKNKLVAARLWRQDCLFDVVRLVAFAHYLLRTTRIHCIWHSLEEPQELVEFRRFINELESDHEEVGGTLQAHYKALTDPHDKFADYYREQLSISVRKMQDARRILERVTSKEVKGPFDYRDSIPDYENPYDAPPITRIEMTAELQKQIVAALIEERVKDAD